MTVAKIPDGAVIIAGDDRRLLANCVARVQHSRRLARKPPSARLDAILDVLAGGGQPDSPHGDVAETGTTTETELMGVAEVARLLGCSPRTARRLAPKLDGRQIGGRWMFDRIAVQDHLAGKQEP